MVFTAGTGMESVALSCNSQRSSAPMHELLRLTCLLALLTMISGCKDVCDGGADVPAISSEDYDRSCSVDTECVSVPEGSVCEDCALYCLQAGAVNKRVEAQYRSDVATLVRQFPKPACRCPGPRDPCCINGVCRHDLSCGQR
jgi:hypothetical protein